MQKKTIIIIIAVLAIIAIALVALLVTNKQSSGGGNSDTLGQTEDSEDISLELTSSTENGVIIIYAQATSKNDSVKSITLPNGEVVEGDSVNYEATSMGDYNFTATANNGATVTKTITIENLEEASADNPYIPDGFSHVSETEVDTGYVIEDENGNQYVWIPVSSGILTRNTEGNDQYEETDSTATGLNNSVAKYYGFYIARYEASKTIYEDTDTVASVEGVIPWTNVTYTEAYEASLKSANVYGYTGVSTALINSYAWDTALLWLNKTVSNYSSNTSHGNYSGTILATGNTDNDEVNMICDMAGNVREWTTEIYYPSEIVETEETETETEDETEELEDDNTSTIYRVVRGGSANINKVANSHIGQQEKMSDAYWGFRTILYKE